MGFTVDCITMRQTLIKIEQYITNRQKCQHVSLNAGKVVLAYHNKNLKEIINNSEIVNADGKSIVWAGKFLKQTVPERVTGIDLMMQLIKLSVAKNYRIYLFGAKEEVVTKVVRLLSEAYPSLQIVGYRNGYFSESCNQEIVENINRTGADILFLGFSSPKKEYWLNQNMDTLNIPFCMGVGGSFDVIAGRTKRAPVWMQKIGLEWFYRFLQEPKRMWKRYMIGNLKFLIYLFKEKLEINHKN